MKQTLQRVRNRVEELAIKINAPAEALPTYGKSKDFAHPHIEVDEDGLYYYVVVERGVELERKVTPNLNELLHWIFKNVSFTMACHFEFQNRIEDKDFRRILFSKQEELLGILNNTWKEEQIEEHDQILKRNPFEDASLLRSTYCRELRGKGLSQEEIDFLAYKKYPKK